MKTTFYIVCMLIALLAICNNSHAQNANTTLSNLVAPTSINAALVPDKNNKHNLGSTNKAWKILYLDSAIYIDSSRFIAFKTGSGEGNTAIGKQVLYLDSIGYSNTAVGYKCLYYNKNGYENTAMGRGALYKNTSGYHNTGLGYWALFSDTSGAENTATGSFSLYSNTTGNSNIANGGYSLYSNTSGNLNAAFGISSLYTNTSGYSNTAIGTNVLYYNKTGHENTAVGSGALFSNTADYNTAIGINALSANATGGYNTASGSYALFFNTKGSFNTANGENALYNNTTGDENTAYGDLAGSNVTNGGNNTFIGASANCGLGGHLTNSTALGYSANVTTNNTVRIGNSDITSIGGFVNWSNISDGRVKKNIKQNVPGLAFINKLQAITYNLDLDVADKILNAPQKDKAGKTIQPSQFNIDARKEKEQIIYTGFIAQDVEKSAKALNYDFSGVDAAKNEHDLYGLRYSDFVVPLVKAVQELSAQNDSLKNENENLEARVSKLEAMMNGQSSSSLNNLHYTNLSVANLSQNSPNPFSNSTTINYNLPQQYSSAKIIVTDKNGNALKQINLSGNKGSVNVDAATLSAGAYQYTLYVDGKLIASKQMIISN